MKLGEEDIWIVESNLGEKVILENGDEIWLDAPMYEYEIEEVITEANAMYKSFFFILQI